jgi:subtilisin family serine protease
MAANVKSTKRPSVVNTSIAVGRNQAIDDAVLDLIGDGITVVTAAGNNSEDAGNTSPAHLAEVITVGASNITNQMTWFTNFGPAVHIFAPGEWITSAWIIGPDSTRIGWGTSLASPHVTGLAAYFLSVDPT